MDWGSALGGAMKGINEGIDLGNKIKNSWLEDDKRQLAEEELAYKMRPISYQETDTWKQMTEPQRVAAASALGGKQQASQAEWGRIQETIGRDQKIALDNMAYAEKTTPVDVKELFPSWDNYNEQFKTAILSKAKDGKMTRYDADKLKAYYKDDQEVQALNAEADIKTAKQKHAKLVRLRNELPDNDPRIKEIDAQIDAVKEQAVSAQDLMIISGYKAMVPKITHAPTRQAAESAIRSGDGVRLQTIVDGWINDSRDSASKLELEKLRIAAIKAAEGIKESRLPINYDKAAADDLLLMYQTGFKDDKWNKKIQEGVAGGVPNANMETNQMRAYREILGISTELMQKDKRLTPRQANTIAVQKWHETYGRGQGLGGSSLEPESPASALERDKTIRQKEAEARGKAEKNRQYYKKILTDSRLYPDNAAVEAMVKGTPIVKKGTDYYVGSIKLRPSDPEDSYPVGI